MTEAVLFYSLAACLLGLGLWVVLAPHPLGGALALLGALGCLAALYALLAAPVVAALQVLVYAGGILVLMVFVLMTLARGEDGLRELRCDFPTALAAFAAALVGLALPLVARSFALPSVFSGTSSQGFGSLASVADALFGPLLFPFEVLSWVLLAAVVGALALAQRRP